MIKVDNLEVGKRYWLDADKNISGTFKGIFKPESGVDYTSFDNIIKSEAYDDVYRIEVNGDIEFAHMENQIFLECEMA